MLKFFHPDFKNYKPGQFYFVNIPEISINEWHPFTATAMLDDGGLLFFIKVMANKAKAKSKMNVLSAWTARLADLVKADAQWLPLVRVHGPFGHNDFSEYETLLLFAGGIGITPLIAIFADLRARALAGESNLGKLKCVVLVWMSRFVDEFRMFEELLGMIVEDRVKVWSNRSVLVSEAEKMSMGKRLSVGNWRTGRPSTASGLASIKESSLGVSDVGAGPDSVAHGTKDSAATNATTTIFLEVPPSSSSNVQATASAATTEAPNTSENSDNPKMTFNSDVARTMPVPGALTGESTVDEAAIESGLAKAMEAMKKAGDVSQKRGSFLREDLLKTETGACTFDLQLHCTRQQSFESLSDDADGYLKMLIKEGRCDLESIFNKHEMGRSTMAAACGPFSLAQDISALAWKYGCDFHSEQFYF